MVVAIGGGGKSALLGAADVRGVRSGGDVVQIAPSVERVTFSPAMRGAVGVRGGCERGSDSAELIIRECLRASGIETFVPRSVGWDPPV